MKEVTPQELIKGLFILCRTHQAHGSDHPLNLQAAQRVEVVIQALAPISLQFINGATFVNRTMMTMDPELFKKGRHVAVALRNLDADEIEFSTSVTIKTLLRFGHWLGRGAAGECPDFVDVKLPGMSWRAIPHAQWGQAQEEIDPGLFALSQIALAIEAAGTIQIDGEWDWSKGLTVVKRIERAVEASRRHAISAIELGEGSWTPARRAVSAACDMFLAMTHLKLAASTTRACAHATFALGLVGWHSPKSISIDVAARALLDTMIASPVRSRSGLPPHRLRTTTLIHTFAHGELTTWLSTMFLIQCCYDIQGERCTEGVQFSLTRADLMAIAAQDMGTRFPPTWTKLLISIHGNTPPGAYVMTKEGHIGVILDTDPSTQRVQVLVGDQVIHITPPMKLLSSLEAQHHMLS